MKTKQTVTAILFLILLAGGVVLLLTGWNSGGNVKNLLKSALAAEGVSTKVETLIDGAETAINEDLDRDHAFIETFGAIQLWMGRRVVQDVDPSSTVVKLSTGALTFVDLSARYVDTAPHAEALADFADRLETHGIPLLYVNAPQKIPRNSDLLPAGVTEYGNEVGDRLLEVLQARGVSALDLRDAFEGAEENYADWFFVTDHHWKPSAAFFAYQTLAPALETYGIHTEERWLDRNSYEITTYEDWFLGSQGKRVGSFYAGVDDIELWQPKEETSFTYDVDAYGIHRSGSWTESLLFPERLEPKDWFGGNPYTLYSGGDYPLATIVNQNNPEGGDLVLIRDSFACALTPFLAQSCHTLTTIDLRYFTGDLEATIAGLDPDLVMVLYCTSTARNDTMFAFSGDDTQ